MKSMNLYFKLTLVSMSIASLVACNGGGEKNTSAGGETEAFATCDPGLAMSYTITKGGAGDFKKNDKITIDEGTVEQPGAGFKSRWINDTWENKKSGGKCSIEGFVVFDGCRHEAKIENADKANGKQKIKIKLPKHDPENSGECDNHLSSNSEEHVHSGDFHGGTAHGTED